MKKLWIYAALLAAALSVPEEAAKLGQIRPVETVYLYTMNNMVVIETDTQDKGSGQTVNDAIQNLRDTTAGTIYLDTANYLLVGDGAEGQLNQIACYLKDGVWLCSAEGAVDLKKAGQFLEAHKPKTALKRWKEGAELEELAVRDGRMILEDKK